MPTLVELRKTATTLKIQGRSKMGKAELVREIDMARRTNARNASRNAARRADAAYQNKLHGNAGINEMYKKFGIAPPRSNNRR